MVRLARVPERDHADVVAVTDESGRFIADARIRREGVFNQH
jgi:hypothetical protein